MQVAKLQKIAVAALEDIKAKDIVVLNTTKLTALFDRALAEGKLPAGTDTGHLAYLAMMLVSEGARHWAAGSFGRRSFVDVVGTDIATLIAGTTSQRRP